MKKILIIDDNFQMIESFKRFFSKNPNVVMARCVSVEEALQAIETHQPDIILLDHSLTPDGDEGLEIVEALKAGGNSATLYSITAGNKSLDKYMELGIEIVPKDQPRKLRQITET